MAQHNHNRDFEYFRPRPRRHGMMWWALLVPAVIYSIGVIWYAHNAFAPDAIARNGHAVGSALMVVGGEAGTLAAASEVFRKSQAQQTNPFDWAGLIVSLVATLGNLFIVYAALTSLADVWVTWVRSYGPLALLLCSGLDFYANVMEFGFYNASFEARMEAWQLAEHNAKLRWERRSDDNSEPEAKLAAQDDASNARTDALSDAESEQGQDGAPLACPLCGATTNASGEPFRTQQAISAHMRWCDDREEET